MITPMEGLEDVVDDSCDLDDDSQLDGAQVIGIHQLEAIFTCIFLQEGSSQIDINNNWDMSTLCNNAKADEEKADLQAVHRNW